MADPIVMIVNIVLIQKREVSALVAPPLLEVIHSAFQQISFLCQDQCPGLNESIFKRKFAYIINSPID